MISLRHSRLRVPHARLRVSTLKELEMADGVAFTATLQLDGQRVGVIENHGRGGGTTYQPDPDSRFGYDELNTFAAACRRDDEPVSTEGVLNDLVDFTDRPGRLAGPDLRLHEAYMFVTVLCVPTHSSLPSRTSASCCRLSWPSRRCRLAAGSSIEKGAVPRPGEAASRCPDDGGSPAVTTTRGVEYNSTERSLSHAEKYAFPGHRPGGWRRVVTFAGMTSTRVTAPGVDAVVKGRVEQFLLGLETRVPVLVQRAYVTGSALTDDWQESCSDIDLVFVVSRPVTLADADVLAEFHAATKARNAVDGLYLTASQLAAGPDGVESAPQVVNGDFVLEKKAGQLCWVTWQELGASPVATVVGRDKVRWGPPRPPMTMIRPRVEAFCRENLATYWSTWGDEASAHFASQHPTDAVEADLVVWAALGPPRLVITIRTGAVVSKKDGGLFAAETWPDYADLIHKCIRSRGGDTKTFTVVEMQAAISLLRLVVAEGARPNTARQ